MTVDQLLRRGRHYLRELRLCRDLGASAGSRARLAVNTWRFHLGNALGGKPPARDEPPVRYRARMGGQPFDLWLRTRAGDLFVLHEVLVTECYEIPRGLGIEPTMIVDLGANVGITTLYYARRFPAARFVCVEPDPANAALLRRNVDHLGDRVVVIEAAITARSGVVAFDDSGWSWGVQLRAGGAGGRAVAGLSMPDLMARIGAPSVDLVKIDIENGVAGLFEADRGWLARVRAMIVELVPDYPLERLAADVGPLGFEVLAEGSPVGNRMVMAVRRAGC